MTKREKLLGYINNEMKIPMTAEELTVILSVPQESRTELLELLDELVSAGLIVKTKKNRYASLAIMGIVMGKFVGNERGFGFVVPEQGDDVFIPAAQINGALHGDVVLAKVTNGAEGTKRKEGEIINIVQSAEHRIVGRYFKEKRGGRIVPINRRYAKDVYIGENDENQAQNGDMVIASILSRGTDVKLPVGDIISVIGNINTPGVDVLSVLENRNIPHTFDDTVLENAKTVASQELLSNLKNRMDLRTEQIITIDGDDAKDLDDAIHVKKLENGNFLLGVHIADVGHYVTQNSALDKEAYRRGTSIYLADRVVPMLPEILSNGVCSLNEGEDRLTLSVMMEIDQNGRVVNHEIAESVICSAKRMTYTSVTAILEGDKQRRMQFCDLVPMLEDMEALRKVLRKKRVARGSIDFNFDEARIVLDESGKPIDVTKRERGISNNMIEEFMLVCNETVAEHMFWLNVPLIYRVHEEPEPDAVKEFAKFISPMGYHIKHANGKVHPREFAELIRQLAGKEEELIISSVALRSLMKARYSQENLGHFGLAARYYCHFTSPIRRYPDLAIHRIIKESLHGTLSFEKTNAFVTKAAKQSSDRELEAVDVERTVEDMKKAEYMHEHLGEVHFAVITGITPFGMFATLDNTIEGLVHVSNMPDDDYIYDEQARTLTGRYKGRRYHIGQRIEIVVARADAMTGKIDFILHTEGNLQESRKKAFMKQKHQQVKRNQSNKIQTARYLKKRRKKR